MCGHSYTPVGMATRLAHATSTKDLDVANIYEPNAIQINHSTGVCNVHIAL